jgi:hypothetical protein
MFNLHKKRIQINKKLLKHYIRFSLEPKNYTKKKSNSKIITNKIEKLEFIYFFYMILGITFGSFIYYVKL